ncbi:MAG TPA: DUF3256 family protein [Candidatus Phocaeicola gallistercoris]|nr:DUF3256 family protein [Candidatus Phocaeicola gallistercoris]
MRKIVLTIVVMFSCILGYAQDMRSLFIAIPDSIMPLLTKVNREDFGDFLDSGMKAEVKNRFGNKSEMRKMTSDYVDLQLTSSSNVEMKLLPMKDSVKVICVVHTYSGPVADSEISFYDTTWNKLSTNRFIDIPVEDDFYNTPDVKEQRDSLRQLRLHTDMFLKEARLSEDENTLQFIYKTSEYVDKEIAEKLEKYLLPEIVYQWSNGRFSKE